MSCSYYRHEAQRVQLWSLKSSNNGYVPTSIYTISGETFSNSQVFLIRNWYQLEASRFRVNNYRSPCNLMPTVYPILLDQVLHYHILICKGWRRLLQLTGRFELGLGLYSLVWQRWTLAQYQLIGYLLFTCCRYLIGLRQCHWIIMIVGLLWMSLSLWWSSSVKKILLEHYVNLNINFFEGYLPLLVKCNRAQLGKT